MRRRQPACFQVGNQTAPQQHPNSTIHHNPLISSLNFWFIMASFWLQLLLLVTIVTLGASMAMVTERGADNADCQQSANHLPLIVVTNGSANEGYWSVFYLLSTGRVRVRSTVRNRKFKHTYYVRRLISYHTSHIVLFHNT